MMIVLMILAWAGVTLVIYAACRLYKSRYRISTKKRKIRKRKREIPWDVIEEDPDIDTYFGE